MTTVPAGCRLWRNKNLTPRDLDLSGGFVRLRTYLDESHRILALLQCSECGQLYFYEFYEQVDWEAGSDPQYRTLIPLASEAEAEPMSRLQPFELLRFFPRLQIDWPSAADAPEARWIAG